VDTSVPDYDKALVEIFILWKQDRDEMEVLKGVGGVLEGKRRGGQQR
jgi:hypothetical protein